MGGGLSHKLADGLSISLSNVHGPKKKYNANEKKKYEAMREYHLRFHSMPCI